MIYEVSYSAQDLKKKCHNCHWLKLEDGFGGECICPNNRVKQRRRHVLDKSCVMKKSISKED